ncbi:MAG: ABC transporter permease [Flavobacteriales bacterium]
MRTIKFLLGKELKQIFRNKSILAIIVVAPIIQLLILPFAANYEVRDIDVSLVDRDHSSYSRKLISKIQGSNYFRLTHCDDSFDKAYRHIESDAADLILEIPNGFERNRILEKHQQLFIAVNAINGTKANLGANYLIRTLQEFNEGLPTGAMNNSGLAQRSNLEVVFSNWYNPHLNYKRFMVPGILALLVTMIGGFVTALNIVKEKEVGTIEQINVTPIKKHHFILGKLIPFWVLGNVVFTIGLLISQLVYGIVSEGSILLLYGFITVYLLAVLGFGLLISTFCESQQQAILITFFFMMIFILTAGLFTPIDSMPEWAQFTTKLNPVTYLIEVMRMVILKGSTLTDVLPKLGVVALFGVVLNTWAIFNYKKTN